MAGGGFVYNILDNLFGDQIREKYKDEIQLSNWISKGLLDIAMDKIGLNEKINSSLNINPDNTIIITNNKFDFVKTIDLITNSLINNSTENNNQTINQLGK